jgi:peptidoglycan/xylan/chitin deacetylase (PgdA/CDA1 family)
MPAREHHVEAQVKFGRTSLNRSKTASGGKFACLTYHMIGEGRGQYTLGERQLREQLAFFRDEGYVVESFEELEVRLRLDRRFPERYVVLTVDDGHESSLRAAELFEASGCRATFFITRDRALKKARYLREPEIRELRKRHFSIGTHGTTHRKLTFLSESACIEELEGSKRWLEQVLGEEVRYMAAPGGYINARVLHLACDRGYLLTGTCSEWTNSVTTMCLPGSVNRVNIRQHFSLEVFRRAVEGKPGFYFGRQVRAAALWVPKQMLRASII